MAICKYEIADYGCPWESDETSDDGFCILHSPNPEKDQEAFAKRLAAHRQKHGDVFIGFVFPATVSFTNTEFSGNADFTGAKFSGEARFEDTEFSGNAGFGFAEFSRDAWFVGAKFSGDAPFAFVKFGGDAVFRAAEFSRDAWFISAKFSGDALFTFAKFGGDAVFRAARFRSRTLFISGKIAECDFSGAIIEPPDALVFRDVDLTRCGFLGTDLRKVEITGAAWPKIGSRFGIYDEIAQLPEGETRPWHHIEQLYRQLKQNYEERRDYERASDFHYGEKEMRRKNPKTRPGLRFLLTLYWLISGYGERWVRPLVCGALLLLVCAGLYLWLGLHPKGGGATLVLRSLSMSGIDDGHGGCTWPENLSVLD